MEFYSHEDNSMWALHEIWDYENIMQYTWLKDKEWNDVYEWDIVQIEWYVDWYLPIQKVIYNEWMFCVRDSRWWKHCIWELNCKVIWNIFENPELLETNKPTT